MWWDACEQRRRTDDHLCYIAGISGGQIAALREQGIDSLTDFARANEVARPSRGSLEALMRSREQARVQLVGREQSIVGVNLRGQSHPPNFQEICAVEGRVEWKEPAKLQ